MTQLTLTRQAISQAIATLPEEILADLASFIKYLQFKTNSPSQQHRQPESNSFLMAIAGLSESIEKGYPWKNGKIAIAKFGKRGDFQNGQ